MYCVSHLLVISSFYIAVFFFFKQKTAYEMRISDWSSDVCSSDLRTALDERSSRRAAVRSEPAVPAVLDRRAARAQNEGRRRRHPGQLAGRLRPHHPRQSLPQRPTPGPGGGPQRRVGEAGSTVRPRRGHPGHTVRSACEERGVTSASILV